MSDEETKKILILQTSGVREPRRTYAPVYMAVAAAAMDMDVTIWFTMEGVSLLKKGAAGQIELVPGSGVTLQTWFDRARDAGVKFLACAQALEGEELSLEELAEGCDLAGAAGIIDMSLDADQVFFF